MKWMRCLICRGRFEPCGSFDSQMRRLPRWRRWTKRLSVQCQEFEIKVIDRIGLWLFCGLFATDLIGIDLCLKNRYRHLVQCRDKNWEYRLWAWLDADCAEFLQRVFFGDMAKWWCNMMQHATMWGAGVQCLQRNRHRTFAEGEIRNSTSCFRFQVTSSMEPH